MKLRMQIDRIDRELALLRSLGLQIKQLLERMESKWEEEE